MKIEIRTRRIKVNNSLTRYFDTKEEAINYLKVNKFIQDTFEKDLWWNTEKVGIYAITN